MGTGSATLGLIHGYEPRKPADLIVLLHYRARPATILVLLTSENFHCCGPGDRYDVSKLAYYVKQEESLPVLIS
jgi:hypothetical protein